MGHDTNPPTASSNSLTSALKTWRNQIEKDLKGADFTKRLVTPTAEGIALQPLYTRADLPSGLNPTEVPGQAPFLRGLSAHRECRRLQAIRRPDAKSFNQALREALMNGQDAVVLPVAGKGGDHWSPTGLADLTVALEGVELTAVPIHVETGIDPMGVAALVLSLAASRDISSADLSGSIVADPITMAAEIGRIPTDDTAVLDNLAGWIGWSATNAPDVRALGIDGASWNEAGANAVQELGFALATLADYLREFEQRGLIQRTVLEHTQVTFGAGPRFFTELSKFRAWRVLIAKLLVAMNVDPAAASEITVHARVSSWDKTRLDAHVNMLRSTTESLSAVLGGVDGLEIPPFDDFSDEPSAVGERVARNLHAIVGEEFGFGNPQDAGGGSWYVENLTESLAREAWGVFRKIEAQGGMRAALLEGSPQAQVAEVVARRNRDYAVRKSGLLGSNLFPNLQDKLESTARPTGQTDLGYEDIGPRTWPECLTVAMNALQAGSSVMEVVPPVGETTPVAPLTALNPYRAAEVFEQLRDRAAKIAAQRGQEPTALLLQMGPVKQHKPRSDFSAGFVSVGGFRTESSGSLADAPAAIERALANPVDVVVICSTDDTYPELVPAIASALKSAQSGLTVVLAGQPRDPELVATFRAAGVDEMIHVRANVEETMSRLLSALEI